MWALALVLLVAVGVVERTCALDWYVSAVLGVAAISTALIYGWGRAEARVRRGWDRER